MISISGKYWEEVKINNRILEKIKNDLDQNDLIAKLIVYRNFSNEEILSLNHQVNFINPFRNIRDFIKTGQVLKKHIIKKNNILVYGDYDVDGCISTSLMVKFLNSENLNTSYFIPDRIKDGYGANIKKIEELVIKFNPHLVIMLDCGSNSKQTVDFLNKKKIDTIIIDHHIIDKPYLKSTSIINPKKNCEYSNFDFLCSASLTYFFLENFIKENEYKYSLRDDLIYVLLATISDVMPLRNINRFMCIKVLKEFDLNKNLILKKLFEYRNIKKKVDVDDLGYFIGPIFNSAGRIDSAKKVVELLTTFDENRRDYIVQNLFELNIKRKKIENNILKDLNFDNLNRNDEIIYLYDSKIPEGIIGIIAARLKEYFNKPSVVFTNSNNLIKGSARSTNGFDIGKFINTALKKDLIISGGGHNLAAGIILKKQNIKKFKNFLNYNFKKFNSISQNNYISQISLKSIGNKMNNELKKIGPFGNNNQKPLFRLDSVLIIKPKIINEKYISCFIRTKFGKSFKCISFNPLESIISFYILNYKKEINLIVRLNEIFWNNTSSIQLEIVDIITKPNKT